MAKKKKTKSVKAGDVETPAEITDFVKAALASTPKYIDFQRGTDWMRKVAGKKRPNSQDAADWLWSTNMQGTFFYPRCHNDVIAPLELFSTHHPRSQAKFIFADSLMTMTQFEEFLVEIENNQGFKVTHRVALPWKDISRLNGGFSHEDDFRFEGRRVPRAKLFFIEHSGAGTKYMFFFLSMHPAQLYENLFCKRHAAPEILCLKRPDADEQQPSFKRWTKRLATIVQNCRVLPRCIVSDTKPGNFWGSMKLENTVCRRASQWDESRVFGSYAFVNSNHDWPPTVGEPEQETN